MTKAPHRMNDAAKAAQERMKGAGPVLAAALQPLADRTAEVARIRQDHLPADRLDPVRKLVKGGIDVNRLERALRSKDPAA